MSRVFTQTLRQTLKSVALSQGRLFAAGPVARIAARSAFSTTSFRQNNQATNTTLHEVLSDELKFEEQDSFGLDDTFKTYLENENIEIVNTDGKVLAELLKKTPEEEINIYFDVLRISQVSYQLKQMQEQINESEYLDQDIADIAFVDVDVVVKKDGKAVNFDLSLSLIDQTFSVSGITPFEDIELATSNSADATAIRDLKYAGPDFTNLAEELQEAINQYLLSRGINGELAEFILAYAGVKENNEYLDWLVDLKEFTK